MSIALQYNLLATNFIEQNINIRDVQDELKRELLAAGLPSPKVRINIDSRRFTVKTADTIEEMLEVLNLRYDIFVREKANKTEQRYHDFEYFDRIADHLIIYEKESGKVIGTYRLICSEHAEDFYSAGEFDIGAFLSRPGRKLELSRACIHPDYRNGVTLTLLWKGIVQYLTETKSEFLFGCSSVWTSDEEKLEAVKEFLAKDSAFDEKLNVSPKFERKPSFGSNGIMKRDDGSNPLDLIPPLLKIYLKAGAKLSSQPFFDKDFDCYDFFTVLELKELQSSYERKYMS